MKKSLPPIIAVIVILLSLTVVFGLQTKTAKNPPNPAAAQSSLSLYPQIITENGSQSLELYLQIPENSTPLYGLTLKAALTSKDSNMPPIDSLIVNPQLIQNKWRFPKNEAVRTAEQIDINLIGTSFTIGGSQLTGPKYLLASLPLKAPISSSFHLTIDPQLSKIAVQDGSTRTFKNAGQAIEVKVL